MRELRHNGVDESSVSCDCVLSRVRLWFACLTAYLANVESPVSANRLIYAIAFVFVFSAGGVQAADNHVCGSQKNVPAAKRVTNTARWTTASEEENFGYDVYRGRSKKGPFVKLTKQPILGHGTTEETHKYRFVDDTIDPCKDYWYYVESIANDGTREKFTPVFHAPAKRHPPMQQAAGAKKGH